MDIVNIATVGHIKAGNFKKMVLLKPTTYTVLLMGWENIIYLEEFIDVKLIIQNV